MLNRNREGDTIYCAKENKGTKYSCYERGFTNETF